MIEIRNDPCSGFSDSDFEKLRASVDLLEAQAVPVLRGIMGAVVNFAFIDHFQDTARGHFTIRALEVGTMGAAARVALSNLSNLSDVIDDELGGYGKGKRVCF
jgi:hypothetical protein